MTVQTIAALKGYFNTGDVPSETNFADLIDTLNILNQSNVFTMTAPLTTPAESWIGPSNLTGIYFRQGLVGVGITVPQYFFHVACAASTDVALFQYTGGVNPHGLYILINRNGAYDLLDNYVNLSSSGGDAGGFILSSAGTELMRLAPSGSIMIGTVTDGMTAAGSLAIAKDLAHRGTLAGFYNHAPAAQPAKADHNNWAAVSDVVAALVAIGLFDAS